MFLNYQEEGILRVQLKPKTVYSYCDNFKVINWNVWYFNLLKFFVFTIYLLL